jgi:hypothetical protein
MKTWMVGPYDHFRFEWVVIVHAETRGRARQMGTTVGYDEFIHMRAIRAPELDGKLITKANLLKAGFEERYEGFEMDPNGYLHVCRCEVCHKSVIFNIEEKNANA